MGGGGGGGGGGSMREKSTNWFLFHFFQVNHEDFNEGIIQVQAKKKSSLNYYA